MSCSLCSSSWIIYPAYQLESIAWEIKDVLGKFCLKSALHWIIQRGAVWIIQRTSSLNYPTRGSSLTGNGKHTSWESAAKTKPALPARERGHEPSFGSITQHFNRLSICIISTLNFYICSTSQNIQNSVCTMQWVCVVNHHLDQSPNTSVTYQGIVIWDNLQKGSITLNSVGQFTSSLLST